MPTVLRNGRIYTPAGADLSAMVVDGDTITWLGTDDALAAHIGPGDTVIDLGGNLVTPAFVDSHVHTTAIGLSRISLDLSRVSSGAELLDALARYCRTHPGGTVFGGGWDDSTWSDPTIPTATELDRAAEGRSLYLTRVDAHSALVAGPLLDRELAALPGYAPSGWLRQQAHDSARVRALAGLRPGERERAQRAALAEAATRGIGSVHEMAGPAISGADDLAALLALARGPGAPGVEVVGYWGELGAVETARDLGAAGAGGDLFCDGSIGSHTAALHEPYADDTTQAATGTKLSADEIAEHVEACTRAGLQAGFHAIGDAAIDAVLTGVEQATARLGAAVRTAGHRVEHAELVTDADRFARTGLTASMQPAFDAHWGGPGGMYEQRLGPARASAMNDFNALMTAGTALAFGSDAPITSLDPWGAIRAAAYHRTAPSSISVRAAFNAHTRGGWRAARREADGSGVLTVGAPATYAVWDSGELVIDVPDERVARWSTDPRAAVAGLPDISPGQPLPGCLRTVVRGRTAFVAE